MSMWQNIKNIIMKKICTWSNWDILKKHLNITLTLDRFVCYKILEVINALISSFESNYPIMGIYKIIPETHVPFW